MTVEEIRKEKYISCKWIESGVCFDNGVYGSNVKVCCYLSAPGGGNTMIIEDYHGKKINWDEFFKIVCERILFPEKRALICGQCQWNNLCALSDINPYLLK